MLERLTDDEFAHVLQVLGGLSRDVAVPSELPVRVRVFNPGHGPADARHAGATEGSPDHEVRSALHGVLRRSDPAHDVHVGARGDLVLTWWRARDEVRLDLARTARVHLVEGEVHLTARGSLVDVEEPFDDYPEWIWPTDVSWLLWMDRDLPWLVVACGEDLAQELLSEPGLEAVIVDRPASA